MPSVTFQPTGDDLVAANRAYFRSSLRTPRMLISYAFGSVVFGGLAAGFMRQEQASATVLIFCGGVIFCVSILGTVLALNYLLLPRRVGRIFAQQKALHDEVTIKWDDEGISFESRRGSSNLLWSDFLRIVVNQGAIIFLQSEVIFNFIPTRVLTADQISEIMAHRV